MTKLSELMISILVVSGLVVGMTFFMTDLGTNYGKTDVFGNDTFNQTSRIVTVSENLEQNITSRTGFVPADTFDLLNFLFFDLANTFLSIPEIIGDLWTASVDSLAREGLIIPAWIGAIVGTSVGIFVVLKIVSIVTKREI